MDIQVYNCNGQKSAVSFEHFTFSGGEEHVRIHPFNTAEISKVVIFERLVSSSNVMRLMMAVDALRRMVNLYVPIELVIPYFPYARQDRVCVSGEALGAAAMAGFINYLKLDNVTVFDAHSDVTPALINHVNNVEQVSIINKSAELHSQLLSGEWTLISPDAGATKKTNHIAEAYGGVPEVIQALKKRDLKTGRISKTEILGDVKGKNVIIVDDICDGGRTFIELAKVLKKEGATNIALYVTHGIFSKGLGVFDGLIDTVYTTNSFNASSNYKATKKINVNVINLKDLV